MTFLLICALTFFVFITCVYLSFLFLKKRIETREKAIVSIFLSKVDKIPALIEVMRPYVADAQAFETIIKLHTQTLIERQQSIYDFLEHNVRIQREFLFLMKLSMQIPELQKHEYFVYIRDYIITNERDMRTHFQAFNQAIRNWNKAVFLKNITLIGLIFPPHKRMEI